MTLDALKRRLFAEGYRPLIDELRPWGLMISDLHLDIVDGLYTVAWTERGRITDTLHASSDEAAACTIDENCRSVARRAASGMLLTKAMSSAVPAR